MAIKPNTDERPRYRGIFERPKDSGIWWVHYFDCERRRRREKAGSLGNAIKLYHKRKTEGLQGKKLPETINRKPVLFQELADRALEYSKAHKRSYTEDAIRMPLLVRHFGSRPANLITPGEIEIRLTRERQERRWAPATVNRHRSLMSLVYSLAIKDGKVATNPVRGVKQLVENNERERYLSDAEEGRLRATMLARHPDYVAAVDLAIHSGMRRSEQFELRWAQINWERHILTISRSKHGESRHIPLNSVALAALRTLERQSGDSDWVFPRGVEDRAVSIRKAFERACRDANVCDFTWHCLRHTFASRLVMAGVNLRTVQKLMGHKRIATTERYSHLSPEHELAAVERLTTSAPTAGGSAEAHKLAVVGQVRLPRNQAQQPPEQPLAVSGRISRPASRGASV